MKVSTTKQLTGEVLEMLPHLKKKATYISTNGFIKRYDVEKEQFLKAEVCLNVYDVLRFVCEYLLGDMKGLPGEERQWNRCLHQFSTAC